jgi:acyl carrier protein
MVMTESEIFSKVRAAVAEALVVDPVDVVPEARLVEDLGAESIDFLDIAFRMEQAFGIRIQSNEMLLGDFLTGRYVEEGKITDEGIEELHRRLPHVDLAPIERSRDVRDFPSIFTVDALVRFMETKLDVSH